MGWTGIARREHSRDGLRYPSELTDREWAITSRFIPPAKSGGRRRTTDMREVVNALLYVASSGGAWRMLIDETLQAYKPIEAVMAAQADLVEVVHTLRQVVCVKG